MDTLPPVPDAYDWERFRSQGYQVIDFIADYHRQLATRQAPVSPNVEQGFLINKLEKSAPEEPVPFDQVMGVVRDQIMPGMLHWQHRDFFAWFPSMVSPPAILGDAIANAINQPGFTWLCSPSATELEMVVMNWLVRAFDLPKNFSWEVGSTGGGVIQPSATEAMIVVMLSAKKKCIKKYGSEVASRLVAYCSDQSHFCAEKAANVMSIPHFRKVKTSFNEEQQNYPIDPARLRSVIDEDVAAGLVPFFVSANFGATGTCAVDPLDAIGALAAEYDMWYNVDGAYAGVVAILPESRGRLKGVERANSLFINGSKWFATMFNASFLFFSEREWIVPSLNATGVYIMDRDAKQTMQIPDFKDYQLGLGRPFRSLKIYFVLQQFGMNGLRDILRRHQRCAKLLADELRNSQLYELPVRTEFGLVVFRLLNLPDAMNSQLVGMLGKSREMFLVTTIVEESKTLIRLSLAHPAFNLDDVKRVSKTLIEAARRMQDLARGSKL